MAHAARVTRAVVRADGLFGATIGWPDVIALWDLSTGAPVARSDGFHEPLHGAAFTAGGRLMVGTGLGPEYRRAGFDVPAELLSGRDDENTRWDEVDPGAGFGTGIVGDDGDYQPVTVVTAGDGLLVVVDSVDRVEAWDVSGQGPHALVGATVWGDANRKVLWSRRRPAGRRFVGLCEHGGLVLSLRDGDLVALDALTGETVTGLAVPGSPAALAGHPDAPLVAVAGDGGELRWWHARTGVLAGHVQAHRDRVHAISITGAAGLSAGPVAAAEGVLMSVSRDGTAALWELGTGAELGRFDPVPAPRPVPAVGRVDPYELDVVAGTPGGRRWLVGGRGGQVHVLDWTPPDGGLAALRHGHPIAVDAIDLTALLAALRAHRTDPARFRAAAGVLTTVIGPDLHNDRTIAGPDHPHGARESLTAALVDAALGGDEAVVLAAVPALDLVGEPGALTPTLDTLLRDDPTLAGRLLAQHTGAPVGDPRELLAPFGLVDEFTRTLITRTLGTQGPAAVTALHEMLRRFPPSWHDLGYKVMHLVQALSPAAPDQRFALLQLLTSPVPQARATAMDLYTSAHRDSRHGGLRAPYGGRGLDRAMRACARRELAEAPDPAGQYGTERNRYEAVYTLWMCYEPADRPLVTRVLATEPNEAAVDLALTLAGTLVSDAPDVDDGLLDVLRDLAADPRRDVDLRSSALLNLAPSTCPRVTPWLRAALGYPEPRLLAKAAYALALHDRDRFAVQVTAVVDSWADGDDAHANWTVSEVRRLLENPDDD